MKIYSSYSNKY